MEKVDGPPDPDVRHFVDRAGYPGYDGCRCLEPGRSQRSQCDIMWPTYGTSGMNNYRTTSIVVFQLLLIMLLHSCGAPGHEAAPNTILIIVDALRADHLHCYGYERETSPALDSLAEAGTRWESCQAQAPWTLPAVASILSGLNARQHGTGRRPDGDHVLHAEMPILPVIFSQAGYRTCGIFNVVLLSQHHGFDRGFDQFSCTLGGGGRAAMVVDEFLGWVDSGDGDQPFCAVLHFFDVHDPYDPPAPFDELYLPGDTIEAVNWEVDETGNIAHPEHLEHFIARYDGEIAWVDSELGRLFGELRERDLTGNTVIMVTADHGEEFLERGWVGHGGQLYQELLHVPLIASGPGIPSGRVREETAAQIDILPTLLSLASIEVTIDLSGLDLFDETASEKRPIPASQLMFWGRMPGGVALAAVVHGSMKGIVARSGSTDTYMMFDLSVDPGEIDPLPADPVMTEMLDYYRSTPKTWDPPRVEDLDAESMESLRDLGYI